MSRLARALPAAWLALPVVLAALVLQIVDLRPKVDARFFFAPGTAAYEEARALNRRFLTQELLVVTAYTSDLDDPRYLERIAALTRALEAIPEVLGARSLADGPADLRDARESPLWRRLLLLEGVEASNVILVVDDRDPSRLVDAVTAVLRRAERPDFRLALAGVPYAVDAIARNLRHDFRTFSIAAVGVFAVLVAVLFRSWAILVGSLVTCTSAALLTLLVQQAFGGRIGLLTANLATISFVLTQSHVVFMTHNWRNLRAEVADPVDAVFRAWRRTAVASFWCMVAALLGFVSLLYVEAQPLRELGYGGTIATVCALAAAYLVFPPFLLWTKKRGQVHYFSGLRLPRPWVAALLLLLTLGSGVGAALLNTDPSLLDYFGPDSSVRRSLARVDPHGGSSPLSFAIRRSDGARLDNDESYERMWQLQRALQKDPAVGTILSLPVLMAEADRSPLAKLLTWNWLLDLLSGPKYDRVAEGFVTDDRRQALFMMRMVETGRVERRTAVIARLERTVEKHGFETTLVGGIYALQGRLADLVTRSFVEGLAGLLAACALIGLVVTRSFTAGLAMAACTAAIPAFTLGLFGATCIPLDIVATPAVNVAIGVAVDSMIHLAAAWRRARGEPPADRARVAQRDQAAGMAAFFVVVVAGFAIFELSSFPPTMRFGAAVAIGTTVAAAMALWIFPALLAAIGRRQRRN